MTAKSQPEPHNSPTCGKQGAQVERAPMREPAVVSGFGDGTLIRLTNSIWTATTPIRFAGTWFPHVMSVVRLGNDSVLLHSPCRPSSDLIHAIAQIGIVAHVVAPNWFHDLYLAHYRKLYPSATFWAPPLLKRQKASIIDHALDSAARPPWFDEMPHTALSGLLALDESIFFHRATRTLIVADFLMNASARADMPALTRLGYRFLRLDGSVRVFSVLRWFGLTSRSSLRRAAQDIFQWNPDRLIVGHGKPTDQNVQSQLEAALQWLIA